MRLVLATLVVGLILGVSGGFGTDFLSIAPRIGYWLALSITGIAIGIGVATRLIPPPWFARRPLAAWAVIALAIAAAMTLIVAVSLSLIRGRALSGAMIIDIAPSTFATSFAMTLLAWLVRRRETIETHKSETGAPPAAFLGRLPPKLTGATLWAVEAQDHYLRLHTSAGRDLILMRLSDAIGELEGIEGARTHRSWWVSRAAVTRAARSEGRAILTLPDGTEAPVSRAYVKVLRDGGWF